MDAPRTVSHSTAKMPSARNTSPHAEARLANLMSWNHQRQVTIIQERNKEVASPYVTTRSDAENRLQLKGHCQYINKLQPTPKHLSNLTTQQQEVYRNERDRKDCFDQLFFQMLDEHIVDAAQLSWWKNEIVALLIRDPSAPVKLSEHPSFGSFESFLLFAASTKQESQLDQALLASSWMLKWNRLQASRFLKNDKLRTSLSQIVNKEYLEHYQEKTREWVMIKNYLALDKNIAKLGLPSEAVIRFGEINTLLHSIVEHFEHFKKELRKEPISTLLNPRANQPSAHRLFLHKCVMAKYHGEFTRIATQVMLLLNPPEFRPLFPDDHDPSRTLQKILSSDSNDNLSQVIEVFSKFNYQHVAKINQDMRQLLQNWKKDIEVTTKGANKEAANLIENRRLIQDCKIVKFPDDAVLSQIDHRVFESILEDADINLLNNFLSLTPKDYANFWSKKDEKQLVKTQSVLVKFQEFKYLPVIMKLINQVAVKLELKQSNEKGDCSDVIIMAWQKEGFDKSDHNDKDIEDIYQKMSENFVNFCKEVLVESEPGVLINQFMLNIRNETREHFKTFFKQYERHSSIRFEELVAIHLRYKRNVGLILDLIPDNHPEQAAIREQFLEYILSIIGKSKDTQQNGRPLFYYRKIQAGCPKTNSSGQLCEFKLKQFQDMLRLFNMHIVKNTDLTESRMMLGRLEEAHHVPFPFIFNQSTLDLVQQNEITEIAAEAVKGFGGENGICFHKGMINERNWLDLEKYNDAFANIRKEVSEELGKLGSAADKKQILFHLIRAYTFVSMGAMHESSQTLHLLSIANQELDSLSERKLEDPFYKIALADSLQEMLKSQQKVPIIHFYGWYYSKTLKAVQVFQDKLTGLKQALPNAKETNGQKDDSLPEIFSQNGNPTPLLDYFNDEKQFINLINPIFDKIKTQSSDAKQFFLGGLNLVHCLANATEIQPEQIRHLINRLIFETSLMSKFDITSLKEMRNKFITLLKDKKPFEDLVHLVQFTTSSKLDWISIEFQKNLEAFQQYFNGKKKLKNAAKNFPSLAQETLLKQRGPQLLNTVLLCLAQRIATSIALKQPVAAQIMVEPFERRPSLVAIVSTATDQTPLVSFNRRGNESPQ